MQDAALRRLGSPVLVRAMPRGTVEVWRPHTGLVVTRVTGHLGVEGALEIEAIFRRQVAEDTFHVGFHDWSAMTDYDSDARVLLTRVAYELLSAIRASHFFVRSRVVAFGVQAANIVLRRLTVHSTDASFERELGEALSRRAPGSSPPAAAGVAP